MIEKLYQFTVTDDKKIERIIDEEAVAINHMVLPQGDRLPPHAANSHVYMIVARGTISLQLDDQEEHHYPAGSIINIPFRTFMNAVNTHEETVELFVVKAPGPKSMPAL
ncbi:MAG: cupin domain-containing protein [Anaerolineae bacterium]|nr:cupin domain-containing protein [Anaerolineae bacterium]